MALLFNKTWMYTPIYGVYMQNSYAKDKFFILKLTFGYPLFERIFYRAI